MNAHYLPTCTKPGGMGNDVHSLLPPKKNIAPNYNPTRGETPHGLPYSCIYRLWKIQFFLQAECLYDRVQQYI